MSGPISEETIPYWNVNIPRSEWTVECPDFLAGAGRGNQQQLGTKDADYTLMTWDELWEIIMSNRLEKLKRVPSDLRRYCKYIWQLKSEEGSVMSFILRERVKWSNLETSENMHFDNPDDYKILYNDWPYGVDPRIVHLVVWTKFPYEEDPETGFLTHGAYQEIDSFVEVTFRHRLENPSHVLWFRNWTAIQSVKALPHFHVMLYDPPSDLIKEVTGNDVPMVQKVKENEVDRVQC